MQNARHPSERPAVDFGATQVSLIAAIVSGTVDPVGARAELARRYGLPVYVYLRRCGHAPSHAASHLAGFLSALANRGSLSGADPAQGRFRNFLLAELHHYLNRADALVDDTPTGLELDAARLEARTNSELVRALSPEQAFQCGFALELLDRALQRLRQEATQAGRAAMFDALEPFLAQEPRAGELDALAPRLGTRGLVLVLALNRLRQRLAELGDDEIAQIVPAGEAVAAERDALLGALRGVSPA